jgi:hypothetical protein
METLVLPIHDRRVRLAERLDLVGHGTAALGLFAAAAGALPARTTGAALLVGVEVAAGAALAFAIRHELRARGDGGSARVSVLNLAAAAVLLVQWYVERRAGGKLFSPELLSAVTAAALAFLHPVIQRRRAARRALRVDDAGIDLRTGRLRRFRASWSELRSVDARPDALRFVRTDGSEHVVSLRMIDNAAEVAEAVARAARRIGGDRAPSAVPLAAVDTDG